MRSSLQRWEHCHIDFGLKATVVFAEKNHSRAGSAQGFVGCGSHNVTKLLEGKAATRRVLRVGEGLVDKRAFGDGNGNGGTSPGSKTHLKGAAGLPGRHKAANVRHVHEQIGAKLVSQSPKPDIAKALYHG